MPTTPKPANQPAFPIYFQPTPEMSFQCSDKGMTLRDYFAAKVMQSLVASDSMEAVDKIATWSYEQADAMLKAREG